MKRILATLFCTAACLCGRAESTNPAPSFDEVYKLLREHVVGITGEDLNRAAVEGLINQLSPRVSLATTGTQTNTTGTNVINRSMIYDRNYAYVRIGRLDKGAAERVAQQYAELTGTNKIKGVVLDLRFAEGSDYASAAGVADLFLNSEQPLLDWGGSPAVSTAKTNAITVPVAVLVNHQTRGAAEALAAILRETKVALLIGAPTAGQASIYREFPLQTGQNLRIATSQVKVGKGTPIGDALKPDIAIAVNADDEKSYLDDPYRAVSKGIADVQLSLSTNAPALTDTNKSRSRLNEAELVRRKREGLSEDEEFVDKPLATVDSDLKVIRDPALARAIDLLKALAVVQPQRPM